MPRTATAGDLRRLIRTIKLDHVMEGTSVLLKIPGALGDNVD